MEHTERKEGNSGMRCSFWILDSVRSIVADEKTYMTAIAMALTITNSLAFSRCDRFSQASNIAGSAFSTSGLAGNIASGMVGRFFNRG